MTNGVPIRLGTRASLLARTQSATVADALTEASGRPVVEVLIRTRGDDTSVPLDAGLPGLFVSELRRALLLGEVDVIVHSFKDLPSASVPGIVIGAIPPRVDSRDALVTRGNVRLADLPSGSVVGTSSPRRSAALAALRPDLTLRPIRGNIDSRIAAVREGHYDATVLAMAGLARIDRLDEVADVLDIVPAPAQGALAVECRTQDTALLDALARLDDSEARLATAAERAVLRGIGATCTTAVAAAARLEGGYLVLRAELDLAGRHTATEVSLAPPLDELGARALGLRAAADLTRTGTSLPVLLVRPHGNESDAAALAELGIDTVIDPYLTIAARADDQGLLGHLEQAGPGDWLVVTSPIALASWGDAVGRGQLAQAIAQAAARGVRGAATGARTAAALRELGIEEVLVAPDGTGDSLAAALAGEPAARAVFPHGNLAAESLPRVLREAGWTVQAAVVYDTAPVPEAPASRLLVAQSRVAAVVLRSPSAARELAAGHVPESVAVICAGPTTSAAARAAGLTVASESPDPSPESLAVTVATAVGA